MNRRSTASSLPSAPPAQEGRVESAGVSGTHPRTSSLQPANVDEVLDLLDQQQPQPTKEVLDELAQARRELARRDSAIRKLRQRLDHLEHRLEQLGPPRAEVAVLIPAPPPSGAPPIDLGKAQAGLSAAPALSTPPALPTQQSTATPLLDDAATLPHGNAIAWQPLCFDAPLRDGATDEHRELELEFAAETQFFAGLNQDMHQGGVFVATYAVAPVGTTLTLRFVLPCGTEVIARGRVAWIRQPFAGDCRPGLGVAFSDVPRGALDAIARYTRRFPPLYIDW